MSLNLNAGEYEGGFLRFPEYGPNLYMPETGCAVVFSCSLLHEALAVTRVQHDAGAFGGVRFGDGAADAAAAAGDEGGFVLESVCH